MWREPSSVREITDSSGAGSGLNTSWLTTGFTLAALFAIGALAYSVRSTESLPGSADVSWDRYSPESQQQIEEAYISRDCAQLSAWLATAADADPDIRASYGTGSLDLIRYVDQALNLASC